MNYMRMKYQSYAVLTLTAPRLLKENATTIGLCKDLVMYHLFQPGMSGAHSFFNVTVI